MATKVRMPKPGVHYVTGELRCYVGSRLVCKTRYGGRQSRRCMIRKMVRVWGVVDIVIAPDDVEATLEEIEINESLLNLNVNKHG